ncbi:15856_t:CDS:2 [Cetraspora pellucida]|uniref:15856_t:CDS:1 n=1 Tax=Cetraspora pellucida TaxID=1433469 RepID=A0A9N9D888_9GLOM|nr:15856_t:CDS:2 [Cetraspora pellucida]
MGHIRKNEVPDDHLSKHEYEYYKKKFSNSLKQLITNQIDNYSSNEQPSDKQQLITKVSKPIQQSGITNLKEKLIASNERKIILESQEAKFKYTIKNLKDTIKDFEATINVLRNNEINLKAQYKKLSKELTLLKNKNEESENRKKQLENKINKKLKIMIS